MTREKIIQGLQFTIDMFLTDPSTGEVFEEPRNDMDKTTIDACKGAIELLEQELCEVAVSQQEVIDTIFAECSSTKLDIDFAKVLILQRAIKALPTVQPKTGHWIIHPKGIYAHLVCDKCLSNAPYDCRTNYCPNCGAKMAESQESEE